MVPEIVKKRPVMIVSARLPYRPGLATVVPIRTSDPLHELDWVVPLSKNYHPKEEDTRPCWAKCDLLASVSLERLDRFKIDRRKHFAPKASDTDLQRVRAGVLAALRW
ncbi:MAG: hypothetical protein GVY31_11810 [Alphaproteobacteria bacterium]|jgi:uncharacterized protein YifN (PemK superfamily)|nr:hypothetical protein [Alphaproteobacteria bacterium]